MNYNKSGKRYPPQAEVLCPDAILKLSKARLSIEQIFRDMGETMAVCLKGLKSVLPKQDYPESSAKDTRTKISSIILGFQTSDITRQRLEHVEDALNMLETQSASNANVILHLQFRQLDDVTAGFRSYVKNLEQNIKELKEEFGAEDSHMVSLLNEIHDVKANISRLKDILDNLSESVTEIRVVIAELNQNHEISTLDPSIKKQLRENYTMDIEREIHDKFFVSLLSCS